MAPEARLLAVSAYAGRAVELDDDESNAAFRRAELLLAAGGDPHRPLELHGRAVTSLAADLDAPGARAELGAGLAALRAEADGREALLETLDTLIADGDLAWRCFAGSLLVSRRD